jgi:hypothetical protein
MPAVALGWLFTAGLAALGIAASAIPLLASRLYGVPQFDSDGAAWVRAAGFRDLGLALALGILLFDGSLRAAGIVALATAFIAAGDFASVLLSTVHAPRFALAIHASGVVMGTAAAASLIQRV